MSASAPARSSSGGESADAARARLMLGLVRDRWTWLLVPLVVVVLTAPMLFTARSFASDWGNHLWLVWQQSLNIRELGTPSYYVQSSFGAFYPWFAFNGGTMYTSVAVLAELTGGHPLLAYVAMYLASFLAAYGGLLWLCRQLGLVGWRAHVPGILFVSSSFYISNVYGRGDLPEVVGTSAIPVVVAGALHLHRARRWTPIPVLLFLAGVVFLTGSHTITVLWGVTFLVAVTVVVLAAFRFRWRPAWRRTAGVLGLAAVGLAINAWYLAPALAYQSRILINDEYPGITQTWYTRTSQLFGILRDTHNPAWITGNIQAQLPTLAIVWAVVVGLLVARRIPTVTRRLLLGAAALLTAIVWLVLAPNLLARLGPWQHVEYPYRLITYASLATSGLVMMVLLTLENAPRLRRPALGALLIVTVLSVGLAVGQMWHAPSFLPHGRNQVFASAVKPPPSFYYGPDYADRSRPIARPTLTSLVGGNPLARRDGIDLDASPFTTDYRYPIVVGRSGTAVTNIAAGPYIVKVTGAEPVGRTPAGTMVVRVSGRRGQREVVSVRTAPSAIMRGGVIITLLASAAALVLLLALIALRWRERKAETSTPAMRHP